MVFRDDDLRGGVGGGTGLGVKREHGIPWVRVLLVLLPVWLLVSGVVAVWWRIRQGEHGEAEQQALYPSNVNAAELAEDVRKIAFVVGPRGTADEAAGRGLDRVAALIEGSLGPSNTGYQVRRSAGPPGGGRAWPLIEVMRAGREPKLPAVWVLCGYDAPAGRRGIEWNATGVAAAMAAARELVGDELRRTVRFLFLPHVFDDNAPLLETAAAAVARIESGGGGWQVLCVDGMGRSDQLVVGTRDTGSQVVESMAGLGKVVGADALCLQDDFDLASTLFESGLPAARVASFVEPGGEASGSLPDPQVLAGSSGRLVELLRRLGNR